MQAYESERKVTSVTYSGLDDIIAANERMLRVLSEYRETVPTGISKEEISRIAGDELKEAGEKYFEMLEKAASLRPVPDIEYLPEDDPEMIKAIEHARATLPEFRRLFESPESSMDNFAIKARFSVEGGSEHCWVGDLKTNGAGFSGKLSNNPQHIDDLVLGSSVDISEDMITDWAFSEDGVFHGHFTTKALLPHMSRRMRQQVENVYGWSK